MLLLWLTLVFARPPIEVPFELFHDQVIVQVQIAGKGPFTMLVDTGTDPSVIDLAIARALGLNLDAKDEPIFGGGPDTTKGFETHLPLVRVGGLSLKSVTAVALDLNRLSGEMVRHIDGVIGHSVLNGRTVQIDYPKRVIRFSDDGLAAFPATRSTSAIRVPFHYEGAILLDVLVNGRKTVATLDTGSNETFSLTPELTTTLGLGAVARGGRSAPSMGYNGIAENKKAAIGLVQIGSLEIPSPVVTFFAARAGHDHEKWGISIGNLFLEDYVLTIDYRGHTLLLERVQEVSRT